ncbi:MAG TPA: hypothetical protein VML96_13445 [Egibacteraceae bacterium]|nr:hypothetical protein [Egibacteraceae bacterium]
MKLRKNLLAALMVGLMALVGAACDTDAGEVDDEMITPLPEETTPLDDGTPPPDTDLTETPTE